MYLLAGWLHLVRGGGGQVHQPGPVQPAGSGWGWRYLTPGDGWVTQIVMSANKQTNGLLLDSYEGGQGRGLFI